MSSFTFSTPCGHHGTIRPVQKAGGRMEGKWQILIQGPKVTGTSGVNCVYSAQNLQVAEGFIARELGISAAAVRTEPSGAATAPATSLASQTTSSLSRSSLSNLDKYEKSPNGQAKCRGCSHKIQKGELRIGLSEYVPQYNKYNFQYYHPDCCPSSKKANIRLPSSPNPIGRTQSIDQVLADELASQSKASTRDASKIREWSDLREALRLVRMHLANRLSRPPYMIFHDTTLDELVLYMPRNRAELLAIHGIGPKVCEQFGTIILLVIERYRGGVHHARTAAPHGAAAAPSGDDNDTIQVGETLSVDQLIQQRFDEAERNGETITI